MAKKMGKPTYHWPDYIDNLVEAKKRGASNADAAGHAGMSPRLLQTWLSKGREIREKIEDALIEDKEFHIPDPENYLHFVHCFEKATADFKMKHLKVIDESNCWTASLAILRSRDKNYRETYFPDPKDRANVLFANISELANEFRNDVIAEASSEETEEDSSEV
jgi:hypothetical protein